MRHRCSHVVANMHHSCETSRTLYHLVQTTVTVRCLRLGQRYICNLVSSAYVTELFHCRQEVNFFILAYAEHVASTTTADWCVMVGNIVCYLLVNEELLVCVCCHRTRIVMECWAQIALMRSSTHNVFSLLPLPFNGCCSA